MAKRGETRPFRLHAQWPGGKPWTETFPTAERRDDAARRQRDVVGPTGDRCTVTTSERT